MPPRALAALVSLLVPGAGQWWQRRAAAALLLFAPWLGGTLLFAAPVLHTWLGERADVPPLLVAMAFTLPPLFALLAAWDAWRMGVRPTGPAQAGALSSTP